MSDLKLLEISKHNNNNNNSSTSQNILSSRANGTSSMNQLETQNTNQQPSQNKRVASTSYAKKRKKIPVHTGIGWMQIISETISPWIQQEQKAIPDPLSIFVSDTPKQQTNGNKKITTTNSHKNIGSSSNTPIIRQKMKRGSATLTNSNLDLLPQQSLRANSCSNQKNTICTSNGKVFSISMIKRETLNKQKINANVKRQDSSISLQSQEQLKEESLAHSIIKEEDSGSKLKHPPQYKRIRPLSANNPLNKPPTFPKKPNNQTSSSLFPLEIMNKNRVPELDPIFEKNHEPSFSQNKKNFHTQQIEHYSSPPQQNKEYQFEQKKSPFKHPQQSPIRPRNYQSFEKALLQNQGQQQTLYNFVNSSQTSLHKSNSQKPTVKFTTPSSSSFFSPKQQLLRQQQIQQELMGSKSNYNSNNNNNNQQSDTATISRGLSVTGSGLSVNKKSPTISQNNQTKISSLLPHCGSHITSNRVTPKQQNVNIQRRVGSSVGAMRVNMSHIQAKKKATMNLNQRLKGQGSHHFGKDDNFIGGTPLLKQDQIANGMFISDILKRKQYSSSQTTQPTQLNYLAKLLIKNNKNEHSMDFQHQNDLKPVAFSISNKVKQRQNSNICRNSNQKIMLMMIQQQQKRQVSPQKLTQKDNHSRNSSKIKERSNDEYYNTGMSWSKYNSDNPQKIERGKLKTLPQKPAFSSSGSNSNLNIKKPIESVTSSMRKKMNNPSLHLLSGRQQDQLQINSKKEVLLSAPESTINSTKTGPQLGKIGKIVASRFDKEHTKILMEMNKSLRERMDNNFF